MMAGAQATRRAAPALFAALALLLLAYQIKLLDFLEWGDESETIVAAKLMAHGMALYADVFNHHGPLAFLSGVVLEWLGSFGIAGHRVPILILQWLAALAIYRSPLLRERAGKRYWVAIAMTALVVLLAGTTVYGHAYVYQSIAGLLLMVILAQHTVPAIAGAAHSSAAGVAVGSVLIACLPFLAVTYLPAAGLLFLCALRRAHAARALGWALAAVALNLAFLGATGSFKGYWAFHIYLNAEIMPLYNSKQNLLTMLANLAPPLSATAELGGKVAFSVVLLACAFLARREGAWPWRSALLLAALLSLQLRGFSIHGAPICHAALCLAALLLSLRDWTARRETAALALVGLCALRLSYLLVVEPDHFGAGRRAASTVFSRLARQITAPGETVIAYSFKNYQYILADRLPASGNFFYLPWQERYNDAPILGIRTHACDDIKQARPKLMLIDKWTVWGRFSWDSYAGCVQAVMDRDYTQLPNQPIYVRNDWYARALDLLHSRR
jgi:hypothetical protein